MREFLIPTIGVGTQTIPNVVHVDGAMNGTVDAGMQKARVISDSMSAAIYHYAIPLACIVAICYGGWMFFQGIKEPISKNSPKPKPVVPETPKPAGVNEVGQGLSPTNVLPIKRTAAVATGVEQLQIDPTSPPVKGKALPDIPHLACDNLPPKPQGSSSLIAVTSLKIPIEILPQSASDEDIALSYVAFPYVNGHEEGVKSDDDSDSSEEIDITSERAGSSGTLSDSSSPMESPSSSPTGSPLNSKRSSMEGLASLVDGQTLSLSGIVSGSSSPTASPLHVRRLLRKSPVKPVMNQTVPLPNSVSAPSSPKSPIRKAAIIDQLRKLPKEQLSRIAEEYCSD